MLIVHLFVRYAHVNLCHCFSSSWCRGLAAASASGSSWTFLFTFFGGSCLLGGTCILGGSSTLGEFVFWVISAYLSNVDSYCGFY